MQDYVSSLGLGAPRQHESSLPHETRGTFPLQLCCVFPIELRASGAGTGSLPPDLGVPELQKGLCPLQVLDRCPYAQKKKKKKGKASSIHFL